MTDTQKWQIDLDNFILSISKSPSGKIINVIKDGKDRKLIKVIVRKHNQRDDMTIPLEANGVCTEGSGPSLKKFTCKPIDIFNKFNLNKDEIKVFNTIDEIQNKIQDQLDLKQQNLTNYKLLCAAQKTRLKDFYKQEVLREKDKFTNIIEALKNKVNISNMKQSNYEEKLLLSEDQKNALKEKLSVMSRQQPIFSDIQNTSNKSNITRKQDEKLIKQQKDDFNLLKQELMNKQKMDTMEQQKKFNEQIMLNEKNMKKIQDSKLKVEQGKNNILLLSTAQNKSKQDLNVMKMKQDSLLKEQLRKNKQEIESMKQQMKNKQEMDSMKQQMKNNRESMLYPKKRVKQETDSTKQQTLFYSLFSPKSKEGLNILKKPTKKKVVKKKPTKKKVTRTQVKVFNYSKKLTKTKEGKYRFFWYRNDRYKVKDTLPKLYIKNGKIQYKNGRKLKRVAGKNTEFGVPGRRLVQGARGYVSQATKDIARRTGQLTKKSLEKVATLLGFSSIEFNNLLETMSGAEINDMIEKLRNSRGAAAAELAIKHMKSLDPASAALRRGIISALPPPPPKPPPRVVAAAPPSKPSHNQRRNARLFAAETSGGRTKPAPRNRPRPQPPPRSGDANVVPPAPVRGAKPDVLSPPRYMLLHFLQLIDRIKKSHKDGTNNPEEKEILRNKITNSLIYFGTWLNKKAGEVIPNYDSGAAAESSIERITIEYLNLLKKIGGVEFNQSQDVVDVKNIKKIIKNLSDAIRTK